MRVGPTPTHHTLHKHRWFRVVADAARGTIWTLGWRGATLLVQLIRSREVHHLLRRVRLRVRLENLRVTIVASAHLLLNALKDPLILRHRVVQLLLREQELQQHFISLHAVLHA